MGPLSVTLNPSTGEFTLSHPPMRPRRKLGPRPTPSSTSRGAH